MHRISQSQFRSIDSATVLRSTILCFAVLALSLGLLPIGTTADINSGLDDAIEYDDEADDEGGDIELVFSGNVTSASDRSDRLAVGRNITLFLDGNNVTDRYSVERVTHNGARYVLTSEVDVRHNRSLTVSFDNASIDGRVFFDLDNASVQVTAGTVAVDPESPNDVVVPTSSPVALNFSGVDTIFEITEDGNRFRGPFSSGFNSTVALFSGKDATNNRTYNVTVDTNGDGFGDTVGGQVIFTDLQFDSDRGFMGAVEYDDGADSNGGDLEITFSGDVSPTDSDQSVLSLGQNITVFRNGADVTDQYTLDRITEDGAQYILTSKTDVDWYDTLTLSLNSATVGGRVFEVDNATVETTANTIDVDPDSMSRLEMFRGPPIALNFSTGTDTIYAIADEGSQFRQWFSSGINGRVGVFKTANLSGDYEVIVQRDEDGLGGTVGSHIGLLDLGLSFVSENLTAATHERTEITIEANTIDREIAINFRDPAGNVVDSRTVTLGSNGEATAIIGPLKPRRSGIYRLEAVDVQSGVRVSRNITVFGAFSTPPIEYDDGSDSQGGDVEMVFNRPVSRENAPGSPLQLHRNLRLFLNGENVTGRFSIARVTGNNSRYVLTSGSELTPASSFTVSVRNVSESDIVEVRRRPIRLTGESIDITPEASVELTAFSGTPIALNFTDGTNVTYQVVDNGTGVRGPNVSGPKSSVAHLDSTEIPPNSVYNVSFDANDDGSSEADEARIRFDDLGLQVEANSTVVDEGVRLSARISADAGKRRLDIELAGFRQSIRLDRNGTAKIDFGTWQLGRYPIRVVDVETGISVNDNTRDPPPDSTSLAPSAVEYNDSSDGQAGDIELVFANPVTQASDPGVPLSLGANITVFLNGRDITDRFTIRRITNQSRRYVLGSATDIESTATTTISVDNATVGGSEFGSLYRYDVSVSGSTVMVGASSTQPVELLRGPLVALNFTGGMNREFDIDKNGARQRTRATGSHSTTFVLDSRNFELGQTYSVETTSDGDRTSFEFHSLDLLANVTSSRLTSSENLTVDLSSNVLRRTIEVRVEGSSGRIETVVLDATGDATVDLGSFDPGTYEVRAVDTGTGISSNRVAIEVSKCLSGVVSGDDDEIGLTEIQQAINWWAEGTQAPNAGGRTIGLTTIQTLINAWAEGAPVSC